MLLILTSSRKSEKSPKKWNKSENLKIWKISEILKTNLKIWKSKKISKSKIELFFLPKSKFQLFFSSIKFIYFKISRKHYFEHSFVSIYTFMDLRSRICLHILRFFWFLAEFSIFFTRFGAKDPALKHTTFPFHGFSNGLLVTEKFHFYCWQKSVTHALNN